MWPDRLSNPGTLTYESGALPTALRGPAMIYLICINYKWLLRVDQAFCDSYTCVYIYNLCATPITSWRVQLWIRSAEPPEEHLYENRNNTTTNNQP